MGIFSTVQSPARSLPPRRHRGRGGRGRIGGALREALELLERRTLLAWSPSVSLVADVNTATNNATPGPFVSASGSVLFGATDGINGRELWKSDGTAAGTVMVKDINPLGSSSPAALSSISAGTTLFFADDGTHGIELWKTDGTAAGTQLVKDINPGSGISVRLPNPAGGPQPTPVIVALGGVGYFEASDGISGYALWRSDGTEEGTYQVKDINPSTATSSSAPGVTSLKVFNNAIFFVADDGSAGAEVWRSDGTNAGTQILKDIAPGVGSSSPARLTVSGSNLFFAATDQTAFGNELWKSDGTTTGTVMVKDINPGGNSSTPQNLCDVNGTLFFQAGDGVNGSELWKSDGSGGGTTLVKDIVAGATSPKMDSFTNVGGTLFLAVSANGVDGRELWKSDGTGAGTAEVKDIVPGSGSGVPSSPNFTSFNNKLYFAGTDGAADGIELWTSDGTAAGTVMVKDISLGAGNGSPANLYVAGSTLLFSATDVATGSELWTSDGTTGGTAQVKDINASTATGSPFGMTEINRHIVFSALDPVHGREVWSTDGTAAGTILLADTNPGIASGMSSFAPAKLGSYLYFPAGSGTTQLWRTDGTVAGTGIVTTFDFSVTHVANVGGALLFWTGTSATGIELYKSDGTAGGTGIVADLVPGAASSSPQSDFTVIGGVGYFASNTSAAGTELWRTDGAAGGTALLKDINAGGGSSYPGSFFAFGGQLLFSATTPAEGPELWRSDGTPAGTVLVKDITPGAFGSSPSQFAQLGGSVLFYAAGELWGTDGTSDGTQLVKEIDPGPQFGNPAGLTTWNGAVYFSAQHDLTDSELWKSDGTGAGTVRVKDIYAGSGSSGPQNFVAMDDAIYFQATDAGGGAELWKSDGTDAGTVRVADIWPGSTGSTPLRPARCGSTLYFQASDPTIGGELYRVGPPEVSNVRAVGVGKLLVEGTAGDDAFGIGSDASELQIVIYVNGVETTLSYPVGSITQVTFEGYGGNDTLGTVGTGVASVYFHGGSGNDTIDVSSGTFTFPEDARIGNDSLGVEIEQGAHVVFNASQHLHHLVLDGDATLTAGGEKVIVLDGGIAGDHRLDLNDGDLIFDYPDGDASPLAQLEQLVAFGRTPGGTWTGDGIASSVAGTDSGKYALGIAEASDVLGLAPGQTGVFGGETVDASAILIKFTCAGDANLDGVINGDDYFQIDSAFPQASHGWWNGDFNYDGVVNGDDYFLIDSNFPAQGPPL